MEWRMAAAPANFTQALGRALRLVNNDLPGVDPPAGLQWHRFKVARDCEDGCVPLYRTGDASQPIQGLTLRAGWKFQAFLPEVEVTTTHL